MELENIALYIKFIKDINQFKIYNSIPLVKWDNIMLRIGHANQSRFCNHIKAKKCFLLNNEFKNGNGLKKENYDIGRSDRFKFNNIIKGEEYFPWNHICIQE